MDATFAGYTTLDKEGIPDIPCIDAYQFADNLRKRVSIDNYCGHLLAASRRDYMIIRLIASAFCYKTRSIERFNYGTNKDNEYFYFIFEPFEE